MKKFLVQTTLTEPYRGYDSGWGLICDTSGGGVCTRCLGVC